MWTAPTVPSIALKTLNLEFERSTFNTLTLSVPIPKISLGTTFDPNISETYKKVTIPVTAGAPRATPVVPTPTKEKDSLATPTLYEPSIFEEVVEIAPTLIISSGLKLCGEDDSKVYVPFFLEGNISTSIVDSDVRRLLTPLPFRLATLPAAPNPVASASEKTNSSPTL